MNEHFHQISSEIKSDKQYVCTTAGIGWRIFQITLVFMIEDQWYLRFQKNQTIKPEIKCKIAFIITLDKHSTYFQLNKWQIIITNVENCKSNYFKQYDMIILENFEYRHQIRSSWYQIGLLSFIVLRMITVLNIKLYYVLMITKTNLQYHIPYLIHSKNLLQINRI